MSPEKTSPRCPTTDSNTVPLVSVPSSNPDTLKPDVIPGYPNNGYQNTNKPDYTPPVSSTPDVNPISEDNEEKLMKRLQGVFPNVELVARKKLCKFLLAVTDGRGHLRAVEKSGMLWGSIKAYIAAYPEYRELYTQAQEIGRDMKAFRLDCAAQERATDGVTREVRFKGVVVGTEQEYSDHLLEKMLSGNIPDLYDRERAPRKTDGGGGVRVIYHIHGIARRQPKPVTIEGESVTKVLPESTDQRKP